MYYKKLWLILILMACHLFSTANSSNTRCYSSTDGEMENYGFCTTGLYCYNGSLVDSNPGECNSGEKCCIPNALRRR
ncbi:Hypothetical predicted protein [Paramuricea clavata]|uniref:Uncharacterized protein n=2 Tax=Paramuricea clavata TaxID=317549 RepID=A0A7D9ENC6_PARCT|nr:Hypothetical predicted protein [Paramuricea clavata]